MALVSLSTVTTYQLNLSLEEARLLGRVLEDFSDTGDFDAHSDEVFGLVQSLSDQFNNLGVYDEPS